MSFLFVAFGGAIGAMARYAISLIPVKNRISGADLKNQYPGSNPDRTITLSTCAHDFQDARYVMHGKISQLEVTI